MKKAILILSMAMMIRLAWGLEPFCNLTSQTEVAALPHVLGATINPNWDQLKAAGYRQLTSEDSPSAGCRVTVWRYDDVDGETARKVKVTEVNIAEEAAAAEAARIAAEAARQAGKSLEQKTAENSFLSMCDTLTGTTNHVKVGFNELNSMVQSITNQTQVITVALQLLAINSECQRTGGLAWWNDVSWHPELVQ